MSHHCRPHRVKAARRRFELTQVEVATFIGEAKRDSIVRMENGCRNVSVRFVIGTVILFGRPLEDLFKRLFIEIEEHVAREVLKAWELLEGDKRPASIRKREKLAALLKKIAARQRNVPSYED